MQEMCFLPSSSKRPSRIHACPGIVILVTLLLAGCSPWVTYPPIEGAAHIGHARIEPVPSIVTASIKFSNERFAKMDDEIVFNLPEGSPPRLYEDVARRLGNARPMTAADDRAIHVMEVRIRARDAEADVVYPRPDGHHEMVTLKLRQRLLHHYEVRHSRLWRIHVEPPPAHYPAVAPDAPTRSDAAGEQSNDHNDGAS